MVMEFGNSNRYELGLLNDVVRRGGGQAQVSTSQGPDRSTQVAGLPSCVWQDMVAHAVTQAGGPNDATALWPTPGQPATEQGSRHTGPTPSAVAVWPQRMRSLVLHALKPLDWM